MKSKIIVIEGTDCSGKETQVKLLKKRLEQFGKKVFTISFPNYESPTGKIIGGPYLGKETISKGWFPETAPNVDAQVSSMLFALDRLYNLPKIVASSNNHDIILIDRYTYSAMAHQGGKLKTKEERNEIYEWIEKLEFELLKLPKPDIKIFLHMSFEAEKILRQNRNNEALDENEKDDEHLKKSEMAYLELVDKYNFETVECCKNELVSNVEDIKTIEQIHEEVWKIIEKKQIL